MATDEELWALIVARQQAVLATVNRDGAPQLSNVLYVSDAGTRTLRISTTADRIKARNLGRNPAAALHVAGEDFWQYAVAHATAELSPVAGAPGDPATDELATVHAAFYGRLDRPSFDEQMMRDHRLVVRLQVSRLTGVITDRGRRPKTTGG